MLGVKPRGSDLAQEELCPSCNQSYLQLKTSTDCPRCHAPKETHKQHTKVKIRKRKHQTRLTGHSASLRSAHCTERHTPRSVPALWPNSTESLCKWFQKPQRITSGFWREVNHCKGRRQFFPYSPRFLPAGRRAERAFREGTPNTEHKRHPPGSSPPELTDPPEHPFRFLLLPRVKTHTPFSHKCISSACLSNCLGNTTVHHHKHKGKKARTLRRGSDL